ncbi:hypothetical protein CSC26_0850 [Pseudomonas aeruginosa]|nr:hypothetical protein CSC26_0850 [Pseudomonas aeruginosa]
MGILLHAGWDARIMRRRMGSAYDRLAGKTCQTSQSPARIGRHSAGTHPSEQRILAVETQGKQKGAR